MSRFLIPAIALGVAAGLGPGEAQAYIGPGLGAGAIAAVFGVLAAVVMAFVALLWYPVKRIVNRRRKRPEAEDPA